MANPKEIELYIEGITALPLEPDVGSSARVLLHTIIPGDRMKGGCVVPFLSHARQIIQPLLKLKPPLRQMHVHKYHVDDEAALSARALLEDSQ